MKKAFEQHGSAIDTPMNNKKACEQVLEQVHEHFIVTGYSPPSDYKLLQSNSNKFKSTISLIYQDTDLIYQLMIEKCWSAQDSSPYIAAGVYLTLLSKYEPALHGLSKTFVHHLALKSYLVVGSQQLLPETKRFWSARLYEAVDSETLMLYARAR